MKAIETALPGVLILEPRIFADERGCFLETWNLERMAAVGLPTLWVQDNLSVSKQNVVRGIHYQTLHPQGKLVRVAAGRVRDVAVDLRRTSPTFGRHIAVDLDAESARMLWIPIGFAHGFAVLDGPATFVYKVTDYYCADGERTILWNDPDLAIDWGIAADSAVVSSKDTAGARFRDAEVFEELPA